MKKNVQKKDGKMPAHVLNSVFEHATGGFILFYFNQENGQLESSMSFDTPAHCMALQKYIEDWQEALHQVTLENSIKQINNSMEEMGGDEEAGEDKA